MPEHRSLIPIENPSPWRARAHLHGEGLAVGFIAGLIPCPLTLFVVFFTLARGVPEAGLVFAFAMMFGILMTLATVAVLTVVTRDWLIHFIARNDACMLQLTRVFAGASGALLIALSLHDPAR